MKNIFLFVSILFMFLILFSCKTSNKPITNTSKINSDSWNGKSAAIVLSYDDGLNVHLDNVAPILNKHGLIGTFYVPTASESFKNRKQEWQSLANKGHELGNHTVFHPCAGKSKNRDWVDPKKDLDNYSVAQILKEITTASKALTAIDDKTKRTYGYTCGDTSVLDSSFVFGIKEKFIAARGVNRAYNHLETLDRFNLNTHSMDGHTAEQMKELVDKAIEGKYLLVYLFHGVGGEHDLNVEKDAHDELIQYIKQRKKDIWVSSLVDVMSYVEE